MTITADTPVFLASGRSESVSFFDGATLRGNQIALNSGSVATQFRNTRFVLPPLGKAALEAALPNITTTNGNSYGRMPPGEAYLLRHAAILYDRKATAYRACLDGLLDDGIIDKLDGLMILAAPFQATALQNAAQAQYNGALVGAPGFVAGQGFSGADAGNYVNLAYNPGGATTMQFQQNSAFMALWKGAGLSQNVRGGSNNSRVGHTAGGEVMIRPNSGTTIQQAPGGDYAMAWWTRGDASTASWGVDGATVGNAIASASAAITSATMGIGSLGGVASTGNGLHRAFAAGGYLTVAEKEKLRVRVDALLAALEA
ncbi:MAG: hypothetical protein AB7E60_13925 [Sphingobium sp.]